MGRELENNSRHPTGRVKCLPLWLRNTTLYTGSGDTSVLVSGSGRRPEDRGYPSLGDESDPGLELRRTRVEGRDGCSDTSFLRSSPDVSSLAGTERSVDPDPSSFAVQGTRPLAVNTPVVSPP